MKSRVLFIIISIFLCSCQSKKAVVKENTDTAVKIERNELASDIDVIEYKVDTTRECEQTISFDFIEYSPVIDSVTGKQIIKSHIKKTVTTKQKNSGVTDSIGAKAKMDSVYTKVDSTASRQYSSKEIKKADSKLLRWWWLLILLVIAGYVYYKRKS